MPNNKSIVDISKFDSPKKLAEYLLMLNNNDLKYNEYLDHKIQQKVTNENLLKLLNQRNYDTNSIVEDFECFVCQQSIRAASEPPQKARYHQDICGDKLIYPKMRTDPNTLKGVSNRLKQGKCEAELLHEMIEYNSPFTERQYVSELVTRFDNGKCPL